MRRVVSRGGVPGLLLIAALLGIRWLLAAKRVFPVVGCFIAAAWITQPAGPPPITSDEVRLTILDVGKGDSIVLESPGGIVIVVDSGGKDMDSRVIGPYLRSRGIRRIALLLLTHPHPDHVGGAPGVIRDFSPSTVVDNGFRPDHPLVRRYRRVAEERGIPVRQLRWGTRLKLPDGITISVLAPPENYKLGTTNDTSTVLRVEYGRRAFLLTADAQVESEREMIKSGVPLTSDVLKVGHHGSSASTTEEFLEAVSPTLAVVSVDSENANGYPTEQTVHRLWRAGARILRTDRHGRITIVTDGETLRHETEKPESAGFLPK